MSNPDVVLLSDNDSQVPSPFKLAAKSNSVSVGRRVPSGTEQRDVIELLSDSDSSSGKRVVIGTKRVQSENHRPAKRVRVEGASDSKLSSKRVISLDSPRKRVLSISSDEEAIFYPQRTYNHHHRSKKSRVVDLTLDHSKYPVIDLTGDKPQREKRKKKYHSDELPRSTSSLDSARKAVEKEKRRHNSDQWPRKHSFQSDPDLTPELPMAQSRFPFPPHMAFLSSSYSSSSPVRKLLFDSATKDQSSVDRTPPLPDRDATPILLTSEDDECLSPVEIPSPLKFIKTEIPSPMKPQVQAGVSSPSMSPPPKTVKAEVVGKEALSPKTEVSSQKVTPNLRAVKTEASSSIPRAEVTSPDIKTDSSEMDISSPTIKPKAVKVEMSSNLRAEMASSKLTLSPQVAKSPPTIPKADKILRLIREEEPSPIAMSDVQTSLDPADSFTRKGKEEGLLYGLKNLDSANLKQEDLPTNNLEMASAGKDTSLADHKDAHSSDSTRVQPHVFTPLDLSSLLCNSALPGWKATPLHEVRMVMAERGISDQVSHTLSYTIFGYLCQMQHKHVVTFTP